MEEWFIIIISTQSTPGVSVGGSWDNNRFWFGSWILCPLCSSISASVQVMGICSE